MISAQTTLKDGEPKSGSKKPSFVDGSAAKNVKRGTKNWNIDTALQIWDNLSDNKLL